MDREDTRGWISIKKQYMIDERWDVLATGMNRAFIDMEMDVRVKIEEAFEEGRGDCILVTIKRGVE